MHAAELQVQPDLVQHAGDRLMGDQVADQPQHEVHDVHQRDERGGHRRQRHLRRPARGGLHSVSVPAAEVTPGGI